MVKNFFLCKLLLKRPRQFALCVWCTPPMLILDPPLLPFQLSRPRLWSNGENGQTSLTTPLPPSPTGVATTKQKTWDSLVIESWFSRLLNQQATNPREGARLQACIQKESGAWLTAPPISSLGLRMSNATICITTSLRLGAHLCAPHDCTHCGRRVDETGLHGLSCRRSTGRLPRHNQLNTIIKQSLTRTTRTVPLRW